MGEKGSELVPGAGTLPNLAPIGSAAYPTGGGFQPDPNAAYPTGGGFQPDPNAAYPTGGGFQPDESRTA